MTPALIMLSYAAALAWLGPAPLARLTARGVNARLGLAVWLVAMSSALASAVVAVSFLVRAAIAGWPTFAGTICRSVYGGTCPPQVYRSALFELSLAAASAVAVLILITLTWQYGRSRAPRPAAIQGTRAGRPDHRAPVPRGRDSAAVHRGGARGPAARRVLRAGPSGHHRAHHRGPRGPWADATPRGPGPRARPPGRTAPSADHAGQGDESGAARRSALHPGGRGGCAAGRDAGR